MKRKLSPRAEVSPSRRTFPSLVNSKTNLGISWLDAFVDGFFALGVVLALVFDFDGAALVGSVLAVAGFSGPASAQRPVSHFLGSPSAP